MVGAARGFAILTRVIKKLLQLSHQRALNVSLDAEASLFRQPRAHFIHRFTFRCDLERALHCPCSHLEPPTDKKIVQSRADAIASWLASNLPNASAKPPHPKLFVRENA